MKKAEDIGAGIRKEWQRSSQFAMRSSNKEVFVLYLNGQKVACFSDEWSCKSSINSLKMRLEASIANLLKGLPTEVQQKYGNEFRKGIRNYLNSMKFSYGKESNLNYRELGFSQKTNGFKQGDKILKRQIRINKKQCSLRPRTGYLKKI